MKTILSPASCDELVDAVRSIPHLIAVGAGTKPRLSQVDAVKLSTAKLSGISEYDPSEFTFTAAAGTPLSEIVAALSERGQYLPFDPLLVDAGATLGGTVMAGLSGPGRFRFGGLRDFILGVRFVDGAGRLLRMGGKVVKNAAGFDVPKFFVGSLGRFGVLAEVTFKVFPRPASTMTLRLNAATPEAAVKVLTETASSRFEFEALDIPPGETGVWARLAGPAAALKILSSEIFARWPGEVVKSNKAASTWNDLRELGCASPDAPLVKVALAPGAAVALSQVVQSLAGSQLHLSAGGNVAFVSFASAEQAGSFDQHLHRLNLSGVTLRGDAPLWLGLRSRTAILQAVKQALDPVNRFPSSTTNAPPDSTEKLGPLGAPMTHAVETCVHCGFCLAACPTYRELGQEMDTPRGRIILMKEVLEGTLSPEDAQPHVDRCLGCLACEPACPSGVPYRDLISPFRATMQARMPRTPMEKLRRLLAAQTIPFPGRFRVATLLGRVGKLFEALVPTPLRPMLELIPDEIPPAEHWPNVTPASGERRARVALLTGCAQQVLDPDINTATIEVLTRNGVEVVVPTTQGCCGGLAWHTGDLKAAQAFARRNLNAFPSDVDAILTNAAGCGSAMHEYHLVLRGTDDEARAEAFRKRVMDVSVFLQRLGVRELPTDSGLRKIAYHDACHLSNAQGVRREPRELLRRIPGVELCELTDAQICCGSAGTYNLDQPEIAASLGAKKAKAVIATGAEVVASGNIGCLTQLRAHLTKLGSPIRVRHTMQVLRDAYAAEVGRNGPIAPGVGGPAARER